MASAIEQTLNHAKFLARHLKHDEYSTVAGLILYELDFSPKNDGFTYLRKAIVMRYENPKRQFKDDIYMDISVEIDGTADSERVDQAIRRAIADAWQNRDEEAWCFLFPGIRKKRMSRPSNGDFIARVVWFIELWQGCCEEVQYAVQ